MEKINNLKSLKYLRKKLRLNLTMAEIILWKRLKNKKVLGKKFRRQHSVGNYILDFYCPEEKLAIELDGQWHYQMAKSECDVERSEYFMSKGIKILRFSNKLVLDNVELVIDEISDNILKH